MCCMWTRRGTRGASRGATGAPFRPPRGTTARRRLAVRRGGAGEGGPGLCRGERPGRRVGGRHGPPARDGGRRHAPGALWRREAGARTRGRRATAHRPRQPDGRQRPGAGGARGSADAPGVDGGLGGHPVRRVGRRIPATLRRGDRWGRGRAVKPTVHARPDATTGLHQLEGEVAGVAEGNRFLRSLTLRGLSPRTVRAYAMDLVVVLRWLQGAGQGGGPLQQESLTEA